MLKTLKPGKNITYFAACIFTLDVVRGVFFLLRSGFPVEEPPSFGWIIVGLCFAGYIFWATRYFEAKTAKNILYYIGALMFLTTAYKAALILPTPAPALSLYLLGIGCEVLTVRACIIHLRELRTDTKAIGSNLSF